MIRGAAAAGLIALLVAAPASGSSQSQRFFRGLLLEDRKTSENVVRVLRGGGFVAPRVRFTDLTGDGRGDAIVLVSSGGAAGQIALYVFSTHGRSDGKLRAIFRRQRLHRVTAHVRSRTTLRYRVPEYARGADPAAPAALVERTLRWNRSKRRFSETRPRRIEQ